MGPAGELYQMKILYGIQTTGNGHIVRGKAMIKALRAKGHEVETILSGDSGKRIIDAHVFEPSQRKEGLTFVTEEGRIKYLQTIKELNLVKFFSDVMTYKPEGVDLIISDFEPITARIAKRYKIRSIGVGHMYSFFHDVPVSDTGLIGKMVMQQFAPVDIPLGLHWHHFDQPILPPTIPPDVRQGTVEEDKILVYLPFEKLDPILKKLKRITDHRFYIYCNIDESKEDGNLVMRPFSRLGFVEDLATCSGVICNCGFSMISEALHLGKRVLTKPVKGQTEQESNARALEELGYATVIHHLRTPAIRRWLETPSQEPMAYPDVIQPLVDWITEEAWDDYRSLIDRLWEGRKSQMPEEVPIGERAA